METNKIRAFDIHFKSDDTVVVHAASFEVEHGVYVKTVTFYTETGEKASIHVDPKQVVAIVPHDREEHPQHFQIHVSGGQVISILAHHFVKWSDKHISFRDAENKPLDDIYVSLEDVLAVVPVGESVPADPGK